MSLSRRIGNVIGLVFPKTVRAFNKTTVVCPTERLPAEIALGLDSNVESCSRWPRQEGCSQTCAPQLQFSAADLSEFTVRYEGKNCVSCGTVLTRDDWYKSRLAIPAAQPPEAAELPQVSSSSAANPKENGQPVCFPCWDRGFRAPTPPATSPH
jgi:hypothetical protein